MVRPFTMFIKKPLSNSFPKCSAFLSLGDWRLSPELSGRNGSGKRFLCCTLVGPCYRLGDTKLPWTAGYPASWVNNTNTIQPSKLLTRCLMPKAGRWNEGKWCLRFRFMHLLFYSAFRNVFICHHHFYPVKDLLNSLFFINVIWFSPKALNCFLRYF